MQTLMLEVLKATGALDDTIRLVDLDYAEALDSLVAGHIDVMTFTVQLHDDLLHRALIEPGIHLMNVTQAEAVAKAVPGLKHVVLWRGLVSLKGDAPTSNFDLLAVRTRVLVRKDLHPALQLLLLQAMRDAHWGQGPFNRLGEFPAEQPNDLPLSPTAEAFYRSGPSFWQRYTTFWLTSLVNRIVFFVIPVIAMLIPIIGFAPRILQWWAVRHIEKLHRTLGQLQRGIESCSAENQLESYRSRVVEIEDAVRSLKVSSLYEVDVHRLKIHLRMVQEALEAKAFATHSS